MPNAQQPKQRPAPSAARIRQDLLDAGLHPIVAPLLASARIGDEGTVVVPRTSLEALEVALRSLEGTEELAAAVFAIVALAGFLHRDCRSPAAGAALLAVAGTAEAALRRLLALLADRPNPSRDRARATLEQLDALLGNGARQERAPHIAARRPQGSLRITEVFVPRRFAR